MAACQGALLLVDCSQGVQAQTVANYHTAKDAGLKIVRAWDIRPKDAGMLHSCRVLRSCGCDGGLDVCAVAANHSCLS